MAVCDFCNQEILSADSCTAHLIVYKTGERLKAIPFGEEQDGFREPGERCHDCNVEVGAHHHPGCDVSQCPRCGAQLISCGCEPEAFVLDTSGFPVPPPVQEERYDRVPPEDVETLRREALETVTVIVNLPDEASKRLFDPLNEKPAPAPAPFPPAPSNGEKISAAILFPGVGKCDIWLTEDIAAEDRQSRLPDDYTEEFISVYVPNGFAKYSYVTGNYEKGQYVAKVAVQLRVRPGSDEARVITEVIGMIPPNGGKQS